MTTIEGVELDIGPEAVVVTSATPLTVLSSAIAGGGLGRARVIMNLHVEKNRPWEDAEVGLAAFAARRRLPAPWVGLLTAAATDRARVAIERVGDLAALVVASVGLSNRVAAGWSAPAATGPGTINTIVDPSGDTQVRFYQVNMTLISLADNRKVWVGQKDIRKLVTRSKLRF